MSSPRHAVPAKPEQVRAGNERIARAARRHRFDRSAGVPFLCECDDSGCEQLVRATLAQYELARRAADFVVAYGHTVDGAEVARVTESFWVLRRDPA